MLKTIQPGGCVFCLIPEERKLECKGEVFSVRDLFPVTEGHTLVIPIRHEARADLLTDLEMHETFLLARNIMTQLRQADASITGFNCGYNIGEVAGQSVAHAHLHVIPRRSGDCRDPFGGIRGVIPEKKNYKL